MEVNNALAEKISHQIPKYSHGRYDLLPIFSDTITFNEIVDHLAKPYKGRVDCVCALEATGWILGVAIAQKLNVSFIPIRKGGKLPYDEELIESVSLVDYSHEQKQLCLKKDALTSSKRVLLVDEWIETGAQVQAAMDLLKKFPCTLVGVATISIRGEENKTRNLQWIKDGLIHAVGISIRRFGG